MQREIESIKKKVLVMGAEVEESVRTAVDALILRSAQDAERVINADEYLDRLEVEIEEDCLKILALHQPVAIDLRYVIAILKMNNDLERIGDLAVNIAERAGFLAHCPPVDIAIDFRGMADKTKLMLQRSLDSLVNLDIPTARLVRVSDEEVDAMNRDMYDVIESYIKVHPERVSEALHLLSAVRHLERIADQATNIAEDVIYMVEGEIVRHQSEHFASVERLT